MKPALLLSLAALGLTSPVPIAEPIPDIKGNLHTARSEPLLSKRQSTTGITSNEFTLLGCRPIIFLFARGSAEVGNMGSTVGPPTSNGIKDAFGVTNVATEGIDYPALLSTNLLPGGADYGGIATMQNLINEAAECSGSKIVVAGYR
jgi:cutinase